jgi:hypothetical protein
MKNSVLLKKKKIFLDDPKPNYYWESDYNEKAISINYWCNSRMKEKKVKYTIIKICLNGKLMASTRETRNWIKTFNLMQVIGIEQV